MRSRTIREGSVGLLIIGGVVFFAITVGWLRGFMPGKRSYQFIAEFTDAGGMQPGAPVRYRGVKVGIIKSIKTNINGVEMLLEINDENLSIPRQSLIEANQSGLIGETSVDIRPLKSVNAKNSAVNEQCAEEKLIICAQDKVRGEIGVSFTDLMRSSARFADSYSKPEFYDKMNVLLDNTNQAILRITDLTKDFSSLSKSAQKNLSTITNSTEKNINSIADTANTMKTSINTLTNAATKTNNNINSSINTLTNTATKTANNLNGSINTLTNSANNTAVKMSQLVTSLNSLVAENRNTLVTTLNNFSDLSKDLKETATGLKPLIVNANTTLNKVTSSTLITNLEQFSANAVKASENAALASANLRDASKVMTDPQNILMLQRTLESARVTFENAQKITSDLDKITGDAAFLNNFKTLVNGLSKLVSSTENLQQQIQIAQSLAPLGEINPEIDNNIKFANARLFQTNQNLHFTIQKTSNLLTMNNKKP
jgi:phospholipid/cholesterol/gamma-HCH transport system substrate-binding protein